MAKKLKKPLFNTPQVVAKHHYDHDTIETVMEHSPAFRELMDKLDHDPAPPEKPSAIWRACKEAGSTDEFPQLLGTSVHKRVVDYYRQVVPVYPRIAGIDSVSQLGVAAPRVLVGEAGDLVLKPEGAVIRRDNITDTQYTVIVNTRASGIAFTREAMINDNTGTLNKSAERLGRAAGRTVDKRLGAVILANGNAYDGSAFFVSGHSNTVTTALSADLVGANLLKTGCQAIKSQKDIDSHDYLGKVPRIAFTSITLYDTLAELCTSPVVASPTVSSPTYAAQNPALPYGLRPIEFPWLGDTTDWYIATDPNDGDPAWVVAFLNGRAAPIVMQKTVLPGDFDYSNPSCDIEYDVLFDFEVNMGDWRSAYGGIVSGGT